MVLVRDVRLVQHYVPRGWHANTGLEPFARNVGLPFTFYDVAEPDPMLQALDQAREHSAAIEVHFVRTNRAGPFRAQLAGDSVGSREWELVLTVRTVMYRFHGATHA